MTYKSLFFALVLLSWAHCVLGQGAKSEACPARFDSLTHMEVFTAENAPTVAGGMQTLVREISKKIKYPNSAQAGVESKIIVAFVVDIDGTLKGKRIIKNITGTDLGQQLLDIIDDMTWYPGTCGGKIVPTLHFFPMIIDVSR